MYYSISFPEMFNSNGTKLIEDNKATLSNISLLLQSCKESLFGDPFFGANIRTFIFEQNNIILRDLIIDDIYTAITQFIPQVKLSRNDIKIISKGVDVYATINCINKIDKEVYKYEIKLLSNE